MRVLEGLGTSTRFTARPALKSFDPMRVLEGLGTADNG